MDLIVPLAVEVMAFDDTLSKGLVGYLDALVVGLFIEPSVDLQSRSRAGVADARYYNLMRLKRHASPIPRDVTEQPVLDFVPFARSGWVVANFDDQSRLIG